MVPLATNIIFSDGYEDNVDNGDLIIHSGQGGNVHDKNKDQISDQDLTQGNEVVRYSCMKKQLVR